ncbi:MAG: hypothetical protein ACJ8EH_04865, partial [Sphingomicrobium sp.]
MLSLVRQQEWPPHWQVIVGIAAEYPFREVCVSRLVGGRRKSKPNAVPVVRIEDLLSGFGRSVRRIVGGEELPDEPPVDRGTAINVEQAEGQ